MSATARYTYIHGSRPEGVVVFDDDQKLHSFHDSDPARGQSNCFDLVRIHLHGKLDSDADKQLPVTQRPSYKAMISMIEALPEIRASRAGAELVNLETANDDWLNGSSAAAAPAPAPRKRLMSAREFIGELKPIEWLFHGMVPKTARFVEIHGDPGDGKSFFVVDCAIHAALGRRWNGHDVPKCKVILLIAEGSEDAKYRLDANAKAFGVDRDELPRVYDDSPDLSRNEGTEQVIRDIEAGGGCQLLVIDTLAATSSADENSSELQAYISNVKRIQRAFDCVVWLVHHRNKAGTSARGWSGLRGALDVELETTREGDSRCVTVTKAKGGRDGGKFGFRLAAVPGAHSPRVEYVDDVPARSFAPLSKNQKVADDALTKIAPAGESVLLSDAIDEAIQRKGIDIGAPEARFQRRNMQNAFLALQERGRCVISGENISRSRVVKGAADGKAF